MTSQGDAHLAAVVFDLDGTLVDSVPDIAAAVNVALASAGFPMVSAMQVADMMGNGAEVLIARALAAVAPAPVDDGLARRVHADYLAAYDRAPCNESRLYPGVAEALAELSRNGTALGVCTNKPHNITLTVLERLGIAHCFRAVVGARPELRLKPAGDMLTGVLRELGAEAARSVMVGDNAADAGAAKAAGTRLILVQHGYGHGADLTTMGADAVIPGFSGLLPALTRMTAPAG